MKVLAGCSYVLWGATSYAYLYWLCPIMYVTVISVQEHNFCVHQPHYPAAPGTACCSTQWGLYACYFLLSYTVVANTLADRDIRSVD